MKSQPLNVLIDTLLQRLSGGTIPLIRFGEMHVLEKQELVVHCSVCVCNGLTGQWYI